MVPVDLRLPSRPSVLLVTNHVDASGCPGQIDGLRLLVASEELAGLEVVHGGHAPGEDPADTSARVVGAIRDSAADLVLVLSPKGRIPDVDAVATSLAGRPLIYWEGDCFGRGKPVDPAMARWLQLSDVVFSVAGEPQTGLLRRAGARCVLPTTHTYDHVLFADAETGLGWAGSSDRVVALGNNLMRLPVWGGLPGSRDRFRSMRNLRRQFGPRFDLAGRGWPSSWEVPEVPFARQVDFLRTGRVVANWDHFPRTRAYVSDRLAITLLAARPQVTTRHPGMEWLPGPEFGLFLVDSAAELVATVGRVLEMEPDSLRESSRRGHAWVRQHLSHREAMRYMLARVSPSIDPPAGQPWSSFAAVPSNPDSGAHR